MGTGVREPAGDGATAAAMAPAGRGSFLAAPVRSLHLEITSRCTLACPRCQRTTSPEEFAVNDVPLAVLRASVTRAAFPDLEFVNFCGNYGDPIYHRHFHAVVRHMKAEGFVVRVETNGSFRSAGWWAGLAAMLDRKDRITLSIDGLEDTNPVYRVNSRWRDIMVAVEALRGRVTLVWKLIVFRHNQHQIEAAVARARELGFDDFKLMRSNRFDGRWRGPDGIDPMKPDDDWVSDRQKVAERVQEIMRGRG
jgi:MoaA/NifB/PqqE/SkfB family radical SAM enzyme